eukprot:129847_1
MVFLSNNGALGALANEDGAVLAGSLDTLLEEGEGQLGVVELLHEGAAGHVVGNRLDTHNLNLGVASAMAGGQVVEGLGDGAGLGDVAELLGHVGEATLLGVVAQVNGVVASSELLVLDDLAGENVAVGGLDLVLLAHDLPEAGLGHNEVGGEDLVLEDGG